MDSLGKKKVLSSYHTEEMNSVVADQLSLILKIKLLLCGAFKITCVPLGLSFFNTHPYFFASINVF